MAGQLGDHLAEREGEVLGQVRARGVAALADQADGQRVGRPRERTLAQADAGPRRGSGSQCRPKTWDYALEGYRWRSGCERAAGHHLLRRLEQQPHPARQQASGGELGRASPAPRRPEGDVVAAGVRDAGHGAPPGIGDLVVDRQRVEVGAERDEPAVRGPTGQQSPAVAAARPAPRRERCTTRRAGTPSAPSSGWRCRSRRKATRSSECLSTTSVMTAVAARGRHDGMTGPV